MFFVEFPMFHVEQQVTMRFLAFLFITICLFGCNKPNPHPELADEIYIDLHTQAQNAQKEWESEKKKFEGFKKDLEAVVPQTGTIKYAQKRYFESELKVQKLEQIKKYYELKAVSRKKYTQQEYTKAFQAGKSWPNPEEIESYKKYKEVADVPPGWDTRNRVNSYEKEYGVASSASKSPEKPKKEGASH